VKAAKKGELMSGVISQVTKNAREVIFLSLSEYKGHRLIDIRVHVPGDQEGDWLPTRKGVSLAVGLYPAFKHALAELEKALIQQGLLDREDLDSPD
jgi:hypothetical protein